MDSMINNNQGHNIAASILVGTAVAVSDGSYKTGLSTSATVLQGHIPSHCLISLNAPPGESTIQSLYRTELAGIAGSLFHVEALCHFYNLTTGKITLALDGLQAKNTASGTY